KLHKEIAGNKIRTLYFCFRMAFTAGGRFNFITAQGRHLFKKNTFTVSTLPRARLEPPCPSKGYAGDCRGRAILAGGHLNRSLWGLKTRAPRKLVANKQCCSRDEQDVLVSKLVIDVTGFSRPGVAALRYSHSELNS